MKHDLLRSMITEHFSLDELHTISHDLNVSWDELPGSALSTKAVSLIEHMQRRGRIAELLKRLRQERPHVQWPEQNEINDSGEKKEFTREEREILIAAADNGDIYKISTSQTGEYIQSGNRSFINPNDPAYAAYYLEALNSLVTLNLVRHQKGILYTLTGTGFTVARKLKHEWVQVQPLRVEMSGEGLDLKLELRPADGYEGDRYGFDLYRRSIIQLIEEMDTNHAEKEIGLDFIVDFYASIFSALARHYMVDLPVEETATVQDVLQEMIEWLISTGRLQETITSGAYDE